MNHIYCASGNIAVIHWKQREEIITVSQQLWGGMYRKAHYPLGISVSSLTHRSLPGNGSLIDVFEDDRRGTHHKNTRFAESSHTKKCYERYSHNLIYTISILNSRIWPVALEHCRLTKSFMCRLCTRQRNSWKKCYQQVRYWPQFSFPGDDAKVFVCATKYSRKKSRILRLFGSLEVPCCSCWFSSSKYGLDEWSVIRNISDTNIGWNCKLSSNIYYARSVAFANEFAYFDMNLTLSNFGCKFSIRVVSKSWGASNVKKRRFHKSALDCQNPFCFKLCHVNLDYIAYEISLLINEIWVLAALLM